MLWLWESVWGKDLLGFCCQDNFWQHNQKEKNKKCKHSSEERAREWKKKNKYKQWLKNLSLACNNDIWLLVILLFFVVWIKGQLCPNWMPMPENEVFSGSRVSCSGLKPLGKKVEEIRFCCRRKEGRLSGDKWRRSTSRQNTMTPTLFIARSPMKNCVFLFLRLDLCLLVCGETCFLFSSSSNLLLCHPFCFPRTR